jgi:hypothetical protein
METHWVLAEMQRKQTRVVAVAVIAVAMPVVRADSQMHAALMGTRVAVAVQVGLHPTLCLQRTPRASVAVTVRSLLLLLKT